MIKIIINLVLFMIDSELVWKWKLKECPFLDYLKETEILNFVTVIALLYLFSCSVPFAQGSNKLIYIASWTKVGVKKLSLKNGISYMN